jgi:predicted nucleic-acid-binding Zn-ribbon protein
MTRGKIMKGKKAVNMSSREAKNMLSVAYENAIRIACKNCEEYVNYNPQDAERRKHDLDIELCGINNLYYKMLSELERAETIG